MGVDGTPGSGRALRLDPFALPVRYAARDSAADGKIRQVELDRHRVTLRRAVRGIRMNVGVPISEFQGVSLRLLPADGDDPAGVAVMLEHRDAGLSVPVYLAAEGDDAAAEWRSWSRVLGLPLLVVETDGSLREPSRRVGQVALGASSDRRKRRATIKARRPSILMRRKPGRSTADARIHRGEREIIARE
jgi:hypothetical protein